MGLLFPLEMWFHQVLLLPRPQLHLLQTPLPPPYFQPLPRTGAKEGARAASSSGVGGGCCGGGGILGGGTGGGEDGGDGSLAFGKGVATALLWETLEQQGWMTNCGQYYARLAVQSVRMHAKKAATEAVAQQTASGQRPGLYPLAQQAAQLPRHQQQPGQRSELWLLRGYYGLRTYYSNQ